MVSYVVALASFAHTRSHWRILDTFTSYPRALRSPALSHTENRRIVILWLDLSKSKNKNKKDGLPEVFGTAPVGSLYKISFFQICRKASATVSLLSFFSHLLLFYDLT